MISIPFCESCVTKTDVRFFRFRGGKYIIHIDKKNVNGAESSCWCSGSVWDGKSSGHGSETR